MVNIKVAVRIRPLSQKEINQKDIPIVQTSDKSVLVTNLKVPEKQDGDSRQRIRKFAVDYCYDPKYPNTCTQEAVYRDVGKEVLDSMFDGYNACVLAYGHSASGKTYTMMGEEDDPGLTPRICQGLFRRMNETYSAHVRFHTVISFLEIYNERVRDLLVGDEAGQTAGNNFSLRVREHPKLGPYVQDLSQHIVTDERGILECLAVGNSRRSTAATENNIHSSRSHAVFTIRFKQSNDVSYDTEISSKVHLVDLAGSERAGSAQSKTRLKEGANINKSLVTLGNVISALAESCETISVKEQSKTWQPFVPYRDSVLTWLLKDTLGGNSNTVMIATVSPANSCLNETINTLRYAKRTKRIVNQPIVNEDPKIRTIRELREEVEKLRNVIFTLQIKNREFGESEFQTSKSSGEGKPSEGTASRDFESPQNCSEGSCNINDINEVINDDNKENSEHGVGNFKILPHSFIRKGENIEEVEKVNGRIAIETPSANSFNSDVSKINDEKKTDVNGSVIDILVHETQVFSDSLESFPVVHTKATKQSVLNFSEIDGDSLHRPPYNFNKYANIKFRKRRSSLYKTYKENLLVPKLSRTSRLRICSKRQANRKIRVYVNRAYNSLENISKGSLPKMLHRSRPDLIKGISAHSKDGLPSASSQSFTDVSGLSQSASENSLNSSGSVDSQYFENKSVVKFWPERGTVGLVLNEDKANLSRSKLCEIMHGKSISRQSGTGNGSGSSTPTQVSKSVSRRRADKRSEIVAAVTSRLYDTKKKPDPRMESSQTVEREDDDDGELEELKLCKRARMKLFDLSRKLAMAKRIKKTVDSDTQTDFARATVRVKEKSVITDQSGILRYENCSTNTPVDRHLKKDKEQPIIMNQVFIPRSSNYVVECGKNLRLEMPQMQSIKRDLGTQTVSLPEDDRIASGVSHARPQIDDECFSDDSLEDDGLLKHRKDSESDSLDMLAKSFSNRSSIKSHSNENIFKRSLATQDPKAPNLIHSRRSIDSLLDYNQQMDRSWWPITRYPISGTNALYEYDPNKSAPDIVYCNKTDDDFGVQKNLSEDTQSQMRCRPNPRGERHSESKIRKTEIVVPLFNGFPFTICTETISNGGNISNGTVNFITHTVNRSLPGSLHVDGNTSSENSLSSSNDGSDLTTSSESSSEDFIFYDGNRETNPPGRQSGLGNLYTISENSELSDSVMFSDPSSPQNSQSPSLTVSEPKMAEISSNNSEVNSKTSVENSSTRKIEQGANWRYSSAAQDEHNKGLGVQKERILSKEYTVHILRNPNISNPVYFDKLGNLSKNVNNVGHEHEETKSYEDYGKSSFDVHPSIHGFVFQPNTVINARNNRENKCCPLNRKSTDFPNIIKDNTVATLLSEQTPRDAQQISCNSKNVDHNCGQEETMSSSLGDDSGKLHESEGPESRTSEYAPLQDQAEQATSLNSEGIQMKISESKSAKDNQNEKRPKRNHVNEKPGKKINWCEVQIPNQRQFLNFNILSPSKQMPFSIDSNMFGEDSKKLESEAKFPSEDSITFVFMAPTRHKTSVLMEIIKRSLGEKCYSDTSISEKYHRKSRNRGVQCKLMRSISVDTAMMALSRFAKHQRPVLDIARTSSLDTLVPEETQMILEQGRLHGVRENGCQCNLGMNEGCKGTVCSNQSTKASVIKYTMGTSTTKDQCTETDNDITDSCSSSRCMVDASCNARQDSEDNLLQEYYPEMQRTKVSDIDADTIDIHYKAIKDLIFGTGEYMLDEEREDSPKRLRKTKKSVSWSDISECDTDLTDVYKEKSSWEMNHDETAIIPSKIISGKRNLSGMPKAPGCSDYPTKSMDYSDSFGQTQALDSQTRRVRFSEPQRPGLKEGYHLLHDKKASQTAANMSAFLKEAVQLLKNINRLSQIYDVTEEKENNKFQETSATSIDSTETDTVRQNLKNTTAESFFEGNRKSSLKKVETSVQTDVQPLGSNISLSAESSPTRRARASNTLAERRERKDTLNLTWPRQRPVSGTALGKPPTGLRFTSKPPRSPLPLRPHSAHSESIPNFDIIKNDITGSSSTSTNWNISNLSTTFSNSNFGDSGCSRISSSKSFYSDGVRMERINDSRHSSWSSSKIQSPRLSLLRVNTDLETELEESCRRLEKTVEEDRLREEKSTFSILPLSTKKCVPPKMVCAPYDYVEKSWNTGDIFSQFDEAVNSIDQRPKELSQEPLRKISLCSDTRLSTSPSLTRYRSSFGKEGGKNLFRSSERKIANKLNEKPCKCYCHYRNISSKDYRSALELEVVPPISRHCHACCTPCITMLPERSKSAPVLNSTCESEDNKCRLSYYGYCPCSPVFLPYVKSSPRAYMQHLLSLRRKIVSKTRLNHNSPMHEVLGSGKEEIISIT